MPQTEVFFYRDEDGTVPVYAWLQELAAEDRRAAAACIARLRLLEAFGHELRRPHADYLRDGIYELRARRGNVNYRILYFYHGQDVAILAHGLTKKKRVPPADIERAIERKQRYEQAPEEFRATITIPEDAQDV
ncbi:MAG TPA: type II toxin-antitoxin system RelE/ParE family toxin [Thermoguttaceae bacterium]|nr:type II toxin-antitoxin system RelE/ParE family toxin [Thermoguttaceae bacterium]